MERHGAEGRIERTDHLVIAASAVTKRVADAIRATAALALAIGVVFACASTVVLVRWPPVRSGGGSFIATWTVPWVGPAFLWAARRQLLAADDLVDRARRLLTQSPGRIRLLVGLARDAAGAPAGLASIPAKLATGLLVTAIVAAVTPFAALGALLALVV